MQAQLAALNAAVKGLKSSGTGTGGEDTAVLKKGDTVTVKGVKYRVTDPAKKQAEAYGIANKKSRSVKVAATVKIKGVTCKVTAIASKAFAKCKKLERAVIGKNIEKIGKKAFYQSKKLRRIEIKSKKLKSVGKQALKGISKKAVVKVPKSQKKKYSRFFGKFLKK